MKTENRILQRQAREDLLGKWPLAIGAFFLYQVFLVSFQSIPKVGGIIYILIAGPLTLGIAIFSLSLSRHQNPKIENIFLGFQRFSISLTAFLLVTVFVILWSLLLVVPGIIAALSYSMTYYILVDDTSISAREAMRKSKKMMQGNKWKLFCLHLRFVGWTILCVLSLGIGFLWLVPYVQISVAKFYDDLKRLEVVE